MTIAASSLTTMRTVTMSRLMPLAQRRGFATTRASLTNVAFIGLGQMGYPMAKNLHEGLSELHALVVHDINTNAMHRFHNEMKRIRAKKKATIHKDLKYQLGGGVAVAPTAFDAVKNAEVVITSLPEPAHVKGLVESLLSGDHNGEPLPKRNRIFIDTSTIDPSTSRQVAKSLADAGHGTLVDAPMSGGVVGASAGTLTFMLGCEPELKQRVEFFLKCMGRRVLHCGPHGAGLSAKLANNYLLALSNIATAEAMNLGMRWGLDPKVLAGVINVSTGRCWPSEINNPVKGVVESAPASRDYEGGFGIKLMAKDLNLAMLAAKEANAKMVLGDEALKVYNSAKERKDCANRDFSVIYRYIGGKEE